jgi:hypothetical protein
MWLSSVQVGKELPTCLLDGQSDTYQIFVDTIDSPDDEHDVARNM